MRICIDIDGVIAQMRNSYDESYADSLPMPGAIEKIKSLKASGHHIILHTARRMRTHAGNIEAVVADIGQLTIDWLKKYDIPYDEIFFGKPWADVYIDDNGYRFKSWDDISASGDSLPATQQVGTPKS